MNRPGDYPRAAFVQRQINKMSKIQEAQIAFQIDKFEFIGRVATPMPGQAVLN